MCFFKGLQIELFPENPKNCFDYWRNGESDKEHSKRMRLLLRERAEQNRRINKGEETIKISGSRPAYEKSENYIARSGSFQ